MILGAALILFFSAVTKGTIRWEDDTKYFYFPLLSDLAAALKQGHLPLWEPGLFGGYPLFADGESGMLYPPNLLALRLFQPLPALILLRIARFYLAGAFTFAFLRAIGTYRTGALAGGLAFMLSGFMVGQVVHENLDSGMIWLPLVLYFAERALRTPSPRRYVLAAFGGVALAMQALAVHVQVCVFTALVVFPYIGWRALFRDTIAARLPGRLLIAMGLATVLGLVGAGLSAAQMLPLLDVASRAARGNGIGLAASTINSVTPFQLLTVFFPHLFERPGGLAVTYWVEWEVTIYVGIPVLFLAAIAVALRRDRFTCFFVAVAALSLVLATGRYGPPWVVLVTQDLLGDHGLRSPGRFAFLWSFGAAVLAGLGADWLDRTLLQGRHLARFTRVWYAAVCGALGGLAAALLLAVRAANLWIVAHPAATKQWLDRHYLAFDRTARVPFTTDDAFRGIVHALDPKNPATALWALTVAGGYGLLVAWFVAGGHTSRGGRWVLQPALRALTIVFVALPLLAAATRAHPADAGTAIEPDAGSALYLRQQLAARNVPPDKRPLYRVYTSQPLYLGHSDVEPNVLLPFGIQEAGGYSSLSSSVNLAYGWAAETSLGRMLDTWNVCYVLWPNTPDPLPSYELTSFHPLRPLLSGAASNAGATASFRVPKILGENLRVIATLRDAANVPAGTTVAWVTATDDEGEVQHWPLRVGVEVNEATRPPALPDGMTPDDAQQAGIHPLPVFSWKEYEPGTGRPFPVYLYYAKLPFDRNRAIVRLTVQPVYLPDAAQAILRVYGLGVGQPDWWVHNVLWSDRERFSLAFEGPEVRVYQNDAALPRAYLVPVAVRAPQAIHLKQMAERAFDPERMLFVDAPAAAALEGPSEGLAAAGWYTPPATDDDGVPVLDERRTVLAGDSEGRTSVAPAGRSRIVDYEGDRVTIAVDAVAASWLFLADTYDPSWHAYVDGTPRPMRLANAMFRAVAVPAGRHEVRFQYEPLPLQRGAAISLVTGMGVLLVATAALVGSVWRGRRA